MDVYIKSAHNSKNVSDIILRDGYKLQAGLDDQKCDLKESGSDFDKHQLEPAVWFKVLITHSVTIDCDYRLVTFKKIPLPPPHVQTVEREEEKIFSVFEGMEAYGANSFLDELFDQAQTAVKDLANEKISFSDFKIIVLRLLHCYILPAIKFTSDDLPLLGKAQRDISDNFRKIEDEILKLDTARFQIEKSLCSLRKKLCTLDDFKTESYLRLCDRSFLEFLLTHIERDILKHNRLLEISQMHINDIKAHASGESDGITMRRKERNHVFRDLEQMETVRESIKNVIVRQPVNVKKKSNKLFLANSVLNNIYLEMSLQLQAKKTVLHDLCFSKIKISTVREAIKIATNEVKSFGETFGLELKADGSGSTTNILSYKEKSDDWLTFEDKIAAVLDSNKEIYSLHLSFCDRMKDRLRAIIAETCFFTQQDDLADHHEVTATNKTSLPSRTEITFERVGQSVFFINANDENCIEDTLLRSTIDVVNKNIKTHLSSVCHMIMPLIRYSSLSWSKAWLTYENHMYPRIMSELCQLYECSYKLVCDQLEFYASFLTLDQIGIGEIWIKKFFPSKQWVNISHKVENNTELLSVRDEVASAKDEVNPENPSEVVKMSKDFKCWHLYKSADEDCLELKKCLVNLEMDFQEITNLSMTTAANQENKAEHCKHTTSAFPSNCEQVKNICLTTNDFRDFKIYFEPVLKDFSNALDLTTILGKLKCLTKAFKFVSDAISQVQSTSLGVYQSNSDDVLTVLILLLLSMDRIQLKKLYCQMKLITDLMAPCLGGGIYDCCITSFYAAFQFLLDQTIMVKNRKESF